MQRPKEKKKQLKKSRLNSTYNETKKAKGAWAGALHRWAASRGTYTFI
jgi:hypothetical protein